MRMSYVGIGCKIPQAALVAALMLNLSPAAYALEKVRILIPVRTIDEAFSPFVVAKEKGYFDAEGYDVSLLAVGGSNESALQVSASNAEIGGASPAGAISRTPSRQPHNPYFLCLCYVTHFVAAVL